MSRYVIGLVALAMVAVMILTDRPLGLTSNPRIDEIEVLPDDPRLAELRRQIQWGDSLYPYISAKAQTAADATDVKFGWTYREWNMLGMPFAAFPESGFAAYIEMRGGVKLALIDEQNEGLIEEVIGRDPASGYVFPWHLHIWGWLIVLAIAVWQVLSLTEIRRAKRQAEANESAEEGEGRA